MFDEFMEEQQQPVGLGQMSYQRNMDFNTPANINFPNTSQLYPNWAVSPHIQYPRAQFFRKGGEVKKIARRLQRHGRHGDSVLAHINPEEARVLEGLGGSGTTNPKTGLKEYFFGGSNRGAREQAKQRRIALDAHRMREWEQENKDKNVHMGELANYINSKGVTTPLALQAMKDPVLMGNLLNIVGVPQHEALAAANQGAQLPFIGTPQGTFGDEGDGKRHNFFRTVLRYTPAVIGSIAGSAIGGPAGAMIGGAIGGSMARGRKNKLSGALTGAGIGAGYSALAPSLAGMAGVAPTSMMGSLTGLSHPSLLSQLGVAGAPATGGGIGLFGNAGTMGLLESGAAGAAATGGGGGLGSLFSGGTGGGGGMLQNALLGTSVLGTLLRRERVPEEGSTNESIENTPQWRPDQYPTRRRADQYPTRPYGMARYNRRGVDTPEGYRPGIDPEHEFFQDTRAFSHGGHVNGRTSGLGDKVPALLSDGEFVVSAPVVAALGNFNTQAGFDRLQRMQNKVLAEHYGNFPKKSRGLGSYLKCI